MDLPFDLLKAGWRRLPSTVGQRATTSQHLGGNVLRSFLERYAGKPLVNIGVDQLDDAVHAATKFALAHPASDDLAALAGRELLKHTPVGIDDVSSWARILGSSLQPEDITKATLMNTDDIFEDYLMRNMTTDKEAAGRLLRVLNVTVADDTHLKLAQKLIQNRSNKIKAGALSFADADSAYDAMKGLMKRNYKIAVDIEEATASLARVDASRASVLLHGVEIRAQSLWKNYIDKWLVKPAAESYLTFGMYGPMNVMEDYIRSALGGVLPRRMNVETWSRLRMGLMTDVNMEQYGLSEMTGYLLREGTEDSWNNWILQLAAGGNKKWANKAYTALVRRPGAVGMDVRRNFVGRRFQQIFREDGGEMVEALLKSAPDAPRLNAKLVKELESETYRMMTTGSPDSVRAVKELFTHKNLTRAEVQNAMSLYPDMPPTARDYIIKAYDRGALFKDIDGTMKVASDMLVEDFIKSPEYATAQIRALTDQLVSLDVASPQEMAQCIKAVQTICDSYGALPHQVVAQATVRSRGLPLAQRSDAFNREFDMVYKFLDDSGIDIDRVIAKLKTDIIKNAPSDDYITQSNRLLDIMASRKEYMAEFRAQNMVVRRDIFESLSPKDRTREFWDDFYQKMDTDWGVFEIRDAELYGMQVQAQELLDMAAGIKPFNRIPLKVVDRPLAPQDIAWIIGCRGDDVSKALLDVLAINSKPRFTAHVMAKVRPGDVGFTKEAVESVYDQIINSLHLDPEAFSYISRCKLQTEGLRKEFWDLSNSKLYPEDDLKQIYKYLDTTADNMDNLMYQKPVVPPTVAAPELTTGYRTGTMKPTKGLKATEGEGLYISRDKAFVEETWGKSTTMKYTEPKNPLIVKDEPLYGLHSSEEDILNILLQPIKNTDSEWLKINKQAVINIGATKEVFPEEKFGAALSKICKEKGYDAIDVDFVGDKWTVLIDESLWKAPKALAARVVKPTAPVKTLKSEFSTFENLRQTSMDKAHKWYYKEYPDYTNANAFDAMMKTIFPYWTYESQRWPWLARSFVRHPGTFMAFERWQDNTDYGYVHIPGTSVDTNPFRGTVYGTITTRLTRRDFPEYYDAYPPAGNLVEFMDYISRFGFYPGIHISGPMALLGGMEAQLGETMPAVWKTPLMAAIALFPESESVKFISERLFGDRFRDYMTLLMVNKRGGDGALIWTKMKEEVELTTIEQQMWTDARQEAAIYGVGMEQFGLFRMRTDEQYEVYEKASTAIEEMTGITSEQQRWYRMHGYRIWDVVGGLSFTQQAILQEMDYYRWVGLNTPLLPSRQQDQVRKAELFWDDVKHYTENQYQDKLSLQQDLIRGVIGPDAYINSVRALYSDQRTYIDDLHDTNLYKNVPITLEEKKVMMEEHNIIIPTLHPSKELLNLYFSIELTQKIDEETGEKVWDWDSFWAQREAIEDAVPEEYKAEWDDYLEKNTTPLEKIRRQVSDEYFKPYNRVWEQVLKTQYDEGEQRLINEWYSLRRRGINLDRQAVISSTVRDNGRQLISNFQSDTSEARRALRYANPLLDAWLFYWGRTTSFLTPEASQFYPSICHTTGRQI